jgi:atlastin
MADDPVLSARPIQIVKVDEEHHKFYLSEKELEEVLLNEDVRSRDVVIVSVAGAFRKGKSFILDFFLRYLYAKVGFNKSLFLGLTF